MSEVHIESTYIPSLKQRMAHASTQRWLLYGGSEGAGKTRMAVEEAIQLMIAYPGIEGVIARHDANDVVKPTQIYDAFHTYCPPELIPRIGGEYRSHPMWTRFHNGSRISWMGLKDYSPSSEYGFAIVDQAEECDQNIIRLLNGRLRQRLPSGEFPHFRMILTCNPHPNLEWFLDMVKQYPDEYVFIQALPKENPYLPADFLDVRRKSYTKEAYARLIEGSWDVFAGQALEEFHRYIHVVPPFDTWRTERWPVHLGIDYGLSSPNVAEWVTVSPDGHLFIAQEYSQTNRTPEHNAHAIYDLSTDLNIRSVWIDPRTAEEKADLARSINYSVFNVYQHYFRQAQLSRGTRVARLSTWKEALRLSPDLRDYRTMESPAPRLYITEDCKELIYSLPKLQYRQVTQGHSDDISKQNDHWYDAAGFALTHLLRTTSPYYQIRDLNVSMRVA